MVPILGAIMKGFSPICALFGNPLSTQKKGMVCTGYAFTSDPPRIDLRGILTPQADSRREFHVLGLDGY
jgi:hypothetical protein